jgi:hypothetical protein
MVVCVQRTWTQKITTKRWSEILEAVKLLEDPVLDVRAVRRGRRGDSTGII